MLIGVDDNGVITGCNRDDIEEFIINVCQNNVRPSIIPSIETFRVDDKAVVITSISRGDTAYSTNRGLCYISIESTKQTPT